MKNIMLKIEYDGTNYSGWQTQPNAVTIQDEISKALGKLTGEYTIINGAGRTDAGVHAYGQVATFILERNIPVERIPLALNSNLPEDITIVGAEEVPMDFHARYNAIGKRYIYRIYANRYRSSLSRNYSYHIRRPLDFDKMLEASKCLIGTHDFKGFMSNGSDKENTVRTIYKLDLVKEGNNIVLYIEGNGFLYNMVRIITGTLVKIGLGLLPVNQTEKILVSKDRKFAGHTAPPQGLFLDKVFYTLTH